MARPDGLTRYFAAVTLTLALVPAAWGANAEATDVTSRFAGVAAVDRLQAFEVSGVLILRGRAVDAAAAQALSVRAGTLGYARVANLVQIVADRDDELVRTVERELSIHRALDGCRFSVRSDSGVVRVAGTVRHELQKDVAIQVARSVDGVRKVELDLKRF